MQALPGSDPLADYWPSSSNPLYASKHDPFALFTDMHGGVYMPVPGYPETPGPYNNTNDDPADAQLKKNADAFARGAVTTIMDSRAWTRHSAIFIVADEGDYTGVTANGCWDSPAGCCGSPVLPAGDPDISTACARRAGKPSIRFAPGPGCGCQGEVMLRG
jgi:hypothetical protein